MINISTIKMITNVSDLLLKILFSIIIISLTNSYVVTNNSHIEMNIFLFLVFLFIIYSCFKSFLTCLEIYFIKIHNEEGNKK